MPDTAVTGFTMSDGRVTGLETSRGTIEAETVVLAAGLWTSELARLAGASVALYPAEHVWVMTEEGEGAREEAPFLRDLDGYLYIRHYRGRYVIGAFEPKGKPKPVHEITTEGFAEFGPDWDHFAPVLAAARERIPELETIGFSHYLRAPESFTPDSNFQLGYVPEVPGLFVAAGFNSQGIIFGPGAGRAAAEWIVEGHPTMDLTEVDVARTGRWANQRAFLHERTVESLGGLYEMHWPGKQPVTARGVRRVPLFGQLRVAGAAMGQAAGWERANWFEPGTVDPEVTYSFTEPSWFGPLADEVRATREGVALYDLTTYSKFLVQGPEALAGMQRLCTSNVDVPVGRIVYTLLCNERGGIEMDPTVTRLGEDRFLVLAPTLAQRHTEMLLRNGLPAGATVTDITGGWATLHLAGPRSRELLGRLTDEDLSNEGFPFLTAREIEAGRVDGVGVPGLVHGRARLGAERADGVRRRPLRARRGGRRRSRAPARGRVRVRRGADRARVPLLGSRHRPARRSVPERPRVRGAPQEGRGLRGPRGARERLRDAPRERRLVSVHVPDAVLWHGESLVRGDERRGHLTSASDRADARRLGRDRVGARRARAATAGASRSAARSCPR